MLEVVRVLVYEIYWRDDQGRKHLLGLLPERRRNDPGRITPGSIMEWIKGVLGSGIDSRRIHFISIDV